LVLAVPDLWHSSLWFRYVQTQHWPTDAIRGKAKKPDDWDDEEDGEWEAPMIDNPEYKGHFGFKTGNANMERHEIVQDLVVSTFHFRLECRSHVALPTCFEGLQGSEHTYLYAILFPAHLNTDTIMSL